jgi:hypothetical protein
MIEKTEIENLFKNSKLNAILNIGALIAFLFIIDLVLRICVNYKTLKR